jgi:hypothetical protein
MLADNVVLALLDGAAFTDFRLSPKNFAKFAFRMNDVEQSPMIVRCKCHQNVHITIRPKVIAQHGAEEGELDDLPFPAESGDLLVVYGDAGFHDLDYSLSISPFMMAVILESAPVRSDQDDLEGYNCTDSLTALRTVMKLSFLSLNSERV